MAQFNVDDFDELDFKDPISLLTAIQSLSARSTKKESEPDLLSVDDLQHEYGLSPEFVHTALLTGALKPANVIVFFSREDAERLAAEAKANSLLLKAFEKELDKMAMNYSYKPLLILSLLDSESLSTSIDDITDFYFKYYRNRAQAGFLVEKEDSTFVQNKGDFNSAKRTILRYPVSVLSRKAFVIYEKETGVVRLNELLLTYVCSNKEKIRQRCYQLLDKYYGSL